MHLVMLVFAHVKVSHRSVHEWSYRRDRRLTFTLTKQADYNLTHEERIDEAEINRDGPCQDWDKEDEAEISLHI